eukprot:jgi/Ulvmu1/5027/UM021_0044.1
MFQATGACLQGGLNDHACASSKQLSMVELQAAHAKAMESAERLRVSATAKTDALGPNGSQPGASTVHLDIAPLVQRADVSQVLESNIDSQTGECEPSSDTGRPPESECDRSHNGSAAGSAVSSGRARRSSIFQQTAVGIKNIMQIAKGSNQVAPALFEENVSSRASLSRMPTAVRRGNGLVRTSRGNLVKLVTQDAPAAAFAFHTGFVHRIAANLHRFWQWCTTVYDPFTGQVYFMDGREALHPHAPLYRFWNSLLNLNMLYIFVLVPLKAGFQVQTAVFKYLHIFNSVCLFFDIVVSFIVGYQVGKTSDLIERRWMRVVRHYLTYWMGYDVLTSLPWELLLPHVIGKTWITETTEVAMAVPLIQVFRYLTIARRRSLFSISSLHMKYSQRNMLSFVLLALLVSHWMACAWMLQAAVYHAWFGDLESTWLAKAGVDLDADSLQSRYIQAMYFSITIMATIGFGDITPSNGYERMLCIAAMVLGTWCYAYCITQLVEQVANWHNADVRFKAHQDLLMEYMAARNLPLSLQKRLLMFHDFQRKHAAVFYKESDILDELTPRLRAEVTNFANQDTVQLLKKMKLFEGMDESIVTKLIISLKSSFLPPNEIVCVAGEIGRHLYIIRKGIFEVSKDGRVLALMTEGESFGETVLYHERAKRTATIITRSYCQLFMLSKNAVSTSLATSPDAHRRLKERARDLYREHIAESGDEVVTTQHFGTIDGTTRKSSFGGQPGMALDSETLRRSVERADATAVAKVVEEMGVIKMLLLQLAGKSDDEERSAFDDGPHDEQDNLFDVEIPAGRTTRRQGSIMKLDGAQNLQVSPSKKQVFFE